MAKIMALPKIGVNMTEATIMEWLVKEGDEIKKGDVVVTAETDKAAQDINATESGMLVKIVARTGETVQCQSPIAVIAEKGENISEEIIQSLLSGGKPPEKQIVSRTTSDNGSKNKEAAPAASSRVAPEKTGSGKNGGRVKVSPLAKKTAKGLGIDYATVPPAKPGLRITKKDVERYAAGNPVSTYPEVKESYGEIERTIPLSQIRKVISDRMVESVNTIPRAVLNVRVCADKLLEWKENLRDGGNKVGLTEMILKSVGKVLRSYPILNSRLQGDSIEIMKAINVGCAVDTERGLMVPVIKGIDTKGIIQIGEELRTKAAKARRGSLPLDDMQGGTFTVTNLGMLGIEQFIPIINPPECGILAVGAVVREPVAVENESGFDMKSMMWLSLAFDHRIVDGAPAGKFLMELKRVLENPLALSE